MGAVGRDLALGTRSRKRLSYLSVVASTGQKVSVAGEAWVVMSSYHRLKKATCDAVTVSCC